LKIEAFPSALLFQKTREKQSSVAHRQHKNSTYFPHAKLTFSGKAHAPKSKFPNWENSSGKSK
jgi:hypothetical protein